MINVGLQVRRAVAEDHHQIANLILNEANTHRHLDWRSPLEWIGSPNYWVLEENGRITAVLACPEDPPHVAWIRVFGYSPHLSGPKAWCALWEAAHNEITHTNARTQVAVIVVKQWFQDLLLSTGFSLKQNIILLQLTNENIKPFTMPQDVRIRPMEETDMSAVIGIDLAAFGWFWHNTFESLQRARLQSVSATVAEDEFRCDWVSDQYRESVWGTPRQAWGPAGSARQGSGDSAGRRSHPRDRCESIYQAFCQYASR